jgi:HEAT repeat protein
MLKTLLDQLNNPAPEVRIETLCALVMLEETDALDVLARMWASERHPEVRKAIRWAGTQINAAKQHGYNTSAAMAKAFRLDRVPDEEQRKKDLEEKRLMSKLQTNVNIEQAKKHGSETDQAVGGAMRRAATVGAIGVAFGMGAGAIAGMMGTAVGASSNLSDGSEEDKPRIGQEPIVPARPSDTNINLWLKRLTDANPKNRVAAIVQLRDFNNTAALGPLGKHFATDPDPSVREAARHRQAITSA